MKIYTLIIIILLLVANTGICYSLTYQKLIEEGKNYDNQPIELTGEIIGDIIYKENTYWINILSRPEGIAIGILISKEMAKEIKVLGDYFHIGDIINVKGKFYRFYKDEGGETMIFAKDIKIDRKSVV